MDCISSQRTQKNVSRSSAIAPDKTDVWAAGAGGMILHFDGAAWTPASSPDTVDLHGVYAASPKDVWAVGDAGHVLYFDGMAWANQPSGTGSALAAVSGNAPDNVWAVGAGGAATHFDGMTWSAKPATGALAAVWVDARGSAFAAGAAGAVYRYSDAASGVERGARDHACVLARRVGPGRTSTGRATRAQRTPARTRARTAATTERASAMRGHRGCGSGR